MKYEFNEYMIEVNVDRLVYDARGFDIYHFILQISESQTISSSVFWNSSSSAFGIGVQKHPWQKPTIAPTKTALNFD